MNFLRQQTRFEGCFIFFHFEKRPCLVCAYGLKWVIINIRNELVCSHEYECLNHLIPLLLLIPKERLEEGGERKKELNHINCSGNENRSRVFLSHAKMVYRTCCCHKSKAHTTDHMLLWGHNCSG